MRTLARTHARASVLAHTIYTHTHTYTHTCAHSHTHSRAQYRRTLKAPHPTVPDPTLFRVDKVGISASVRSLELGSIQPQLLRTPARTLPEQTMGATTHGKRRH